MLVGPSSLARITLSCGRRWWGTNSGRRIISKGGEHDNETGVISEVLSLCRDLRWIVGIGFLLILPAHLCMVRHHAAKPSRLCATSRSVHRDYGVGRLLRLPGYDTEPRYCQDSHSYES